MNELKKIAEYLGEEMSEEELVAMFAKADLDNDGFVTKDDFYNIMTGNGYYLMRKKKERMIIFFLNFLVSIR